MSRALVALATLLTSVAFAQPAPTGALHGLPLITTAHGAIDWSRASLTLQADDARVWQAAFVTRRHLAPTDGGVRLEDLREVPVTDAVLPRHRQPSWVMDYQEPAFEPVWAEATQALGAHPTPEAVTAFARKTLTKKGYDKGFDLASQVAVHRSGDCTEHAVFLVALLRRFGIPARGMTGVVLLPAEGPPQAAAHMWAEAFVGGRWKVFDAALPPEVRAAYLPAGELTNEGPAYVMSLASLLGALSFQRLELVVR